MISCSQSAALAFIPPRVLAREAPLDFHLHPRYREQPPLEPALRKRIAANDSFPLEKEHDQIAAILAKWSNSLFRIDPIENSLAPDLRGCSLTPSSSKGIRNSAGLQVHRVSFDQDKLLDKEDFTRHLASYIDELPKLLTAEFQVTRIARLDSDLVTDINYDLVAAGQDFYREQRSGNWQLRWTKTSAGEYNVQNWVLGEEIRSRSAAPFYADVTRAVLGENASYASQLVHGVDYWRTALDGASRIDIYGHNGVSVGDINGDGLDDLYVCQPAGLPNRLYKNRGDGTFIDITEESGAGLLENTACALFADFSNRGHQDLLVVRANGPLLFENDGKGKFRARSDAFRFANAPQGTFTGASLADYDRDGWLDVYFCLYVYYQGADQYRYPLPYYDANNGPPNFLLRNNRDGTFNDVTAASELNKNNTRYSFCSGWTDINNNGWPDLYVVNDFGRKNLYRNNGDGTFTDIAEQSGTDDVGAGMSICCFDYDSDGHQDLYVANMWAAAGERITRQPSFQETSPANVRSLYHKHAMGNSLLRNQGNGAFADKTAEAQVGMGRWSWSSDSWDFDHDGFPDLYVLNGMISGPIREDLNSFFWRQVVANSPPEAKASPAYEQGWTAINELIRSDYSWSGFERNVFYANNRDGTFSNVSGAVGLDFIEDGRSFALTDFDGDGRLEIIIKNRNSPQLRVLKNVLPELPPSISFRLRGVKSNRDAIGAAITITTNAGTQTRMLQAGSGFLSQHSRDILFGLGNAQESIKASVRWPSGLVQDLDGLPANHKIHVEEAVSKFRAEPFRAVPAMTSEPQQTETLPDSVETWLLSPVAAPALTTHGKPALLYLTAPGQENPARNAIRGLELITLELKDEDDNAAIYNLLYRSLFDRHRDLTLPTSFLVNERGQVVKVYQGSLNLDHLEQDSRQIPTSDAERIAKALPFPGNADTFDFGRNYLSFGSIYFQRGFLDQAETWFRLASRDDPGSAEAQYGLGSVYLKQGNSSDAQASFERAVKLQSSYPDTKANAWNNLGLIAAQEGRTDQAIPSFEQALRLNPDHLVALENLGNAYRRTQRWDDARRTLEHAIEVAPDQPEVNYGLGMVFAQLDQPDRAYRLLRRALQLRPNYPEAMNNLGVLYLRSRRRDEAVAEFEACIRNSPEYDQAYLNLSRVYLIEGDPERARQTLLALLEKFPNHPQAQKLLEEIK